MVSAYKENHLKNQIGKGMELRVPIWHSGMREAFLIHVELAQEAIKKLTELGFLPVYMPQ